MENSTQLFSFVLAAYGNIGHLKYLYFTILSVLYTSIVFANIVLIVVICVDRKLHEPMYLFLCSLFVNELYGSMALLPCIMAQVLSDTHIISVHYCFLQIFGNHTYVNIEFCSLAAMAYDRYVAICHPLQYNLLLTYNRVCGIILFVWIYSFIKTTITLSLTLRLTLCGNIINRLGCANYSIVKLACSESDTRVNNYYGLFATTLSVAVPLAPISFSYIKILSVSLRSSREAKQKAMSTCTPHIASLLFFSFGCVFQAIQSRFGMTQVIALYFLVCQPLLNPVLYGLKLSAIRNNLKSMFFGKICHVRTI